MVNIPVSQDIPIWLVVWNMKFIFFNWECHNPNWRTYIFHRSRYTTNQPWYIHIHIYIPYIYIWYIITTIIYIYTYTYILYIYTYTYTLYIYMWIYPNHITTISYISHIYPIYISHLNPIHPMGQVLHPRRFKVSFDGCCRFLYGTSHR